ncbi:histidine kinase dimerization/phospho-acceptor domain-containing protein [Falsiroseomonas selenitidurans]|uniref:histidine kinase n=1 Tax=Falsiroseomonas selenitidurans TaxID=2716335 RepID=A0ABX1EB76_9PROT|nr:histidine kinase dimerization/phospho-acceptor domain-containing protein [Falsiroseomonas selenitidurans]NKC32737.1 hypothetical protein [Falsiroseomonas selenitidurans]
MTEDAAAQRQERLRRAAPAVQHEINNAMMVLAANLDLLNRSVAEGAPRRQLDRAVLASRRLEETIRGFLDMARREAVELALVSPAEVLRQALPLLRVALGARLGAELEAPEMLPAVRLDRAALEIALLALAQDAAPRMPNGSRIQARLRDAGPTVELELAWPEGADPGGLALLRACCARLEAQGNGCVLVWEKG